MKARDLVIPSLTLGGLLVASTGAFSWESKRKIKERAHGASELSGDDWRPLEASHFNHRRNTSIYDNPRNGLLCSDIEHLSFHLMFREEPEIIGLDWFDNDWAIRAIYDRVREFNMDNGLPVEIPQQIDEATERWKSYIDQHKRLAYVG